MSNSIYALQGLVLDCY